MVPIACLMHWYISMMYVVPVVAVGGWGWLSSRRMAKRKAAAKAAGHVAAAGEVARAAPRTPTVA